MKFASSTGYPLEDVLVAQHLLPMSFFLCRACLTMRRLPPGILPID